MVQYVSVRGTFTSVTRHNLHSFQVLEAYGVTDEQKVHIGRLLRGFLQGFSTIESHGGFGNPTPLNDTFGFALKTILNGIRDLQGGTTR